jgi:hypothetical protein
MPNVSHSGNNHKEARSSSRPYINCNVLSINEDNKAVDLSDRPKLFLSHSLPICSDLTGDGKPRPTFISKKLDPSLRELMIALLKEYSDCFAWDYTEMPGLDGSIIEHRVPLKKGFRPF